MPPKHSFIVGCSRSGTTMLQAILANHPELSSFPETNLLYKVLDDIDFRRYGTVVGRRRLPRLMLNRLLNRIGYSNSLSKDDFQKFLNTLGRTDLIGMAPENLRNIQQVFHSFVSILDNITEGKPWIEKTPQHIFCIDHISRYIPDSRFIHIVRNGQDNVASLWDASQKYNSFSDRFAGKNGLLKTINYWNNSIKISHRYRHHPNHIVVRYENVADHPQEALQKVADFLGIEITEQMIRYNTRSITLSQEVWKTRETEHIQKAESKFQKIFTAEQQTFINQHLLDLDALLSE